MRAEKKAWRDGDIGLYYITEFKGHRIPGGGMMIVEVEDMQADGFGRNLSNTIDYTLYGRLKFTSKTTDHGYGRCKTVKWIQLRSHILGVATC